MAPLWSIKSSCTCVSVTFSYLMSNIGIRWQTRILSTLQWHFFFYLFPLPALIDLWVVIQVTHKIIPFNSTYASVNPHFCGRGEGEEVEKNPHNAELGSEIKRRKLSQHFAINVTNESVSSALGPATRPPSSIFITKTNNKIPASPSQRSVLMDGSGAYYGINKLLCVVK